MRIRRLPLAGGLFAFMAAIPAFPAGFPIDPDPRSPTLGDILDSEARARKAVPLPPVRTVRTEPVIPRGAVTVWAPGVKARPARPR